PVHSPDLTPHDFFLWGISKNIVYQNKPITLQDIKQRLIAACATINPKGTTSTRASAIRRFQRCIPYSTRNEKIRQAI
ncbi:hypothetical protein WH47_11898, partial [Habropoda laboriosa]